MHPCSRHQRVPESKAIQCDTHRHLTPAAEYFLRAEGVFNIGPGAARAAGKQLRFEFEWIRSAFHLDKSLRIAMTKSQMPQFILSWMRMLPQEESEWRYEFSGFRYSGTSNRLI